LIAANYRPLLSQELLCQLEPRLRHSMEGSNVLSPRAFSHREALFGVLSALHCCQRHLLPLPTSAPITSGLRGFSNSGFIVRALRALESV
jgi:hypothetical protein